MSVLYIKQVDILMPKNQVLQISLNTLVGIDIKNMAAEFYTPQNIP